MVKFFVLPKLLAFLIIFVLVLAGLYYFKFQKPVTNLSNQSSTIKTNTYKSNYLSFAYPSNFKLDKITTTDGRVVENWRLTKTDNPSPTTILLMLFVSNKDLSDFEPVVERRRDPNQYTEQIGRKSNQRGILFRTIDNKERVVYFSNKNQILLVDYIATTTDPAKETEFQNFLEQIDWK
jgi:hypothetical protein